MPKCPECEGWGVLEIVTNAGKAWCDDPGYEEVNCDRCSGTGQVEPECDFCNDTGVVTKTYEWRGVSGDADDQDCPNCMKEK